MFDISRSVWQSQFSADRLIYLSDAPCVLPESCQSFLRMYGMPTVMIFEAQNPIEIHFDALRLPLVSYWSLLDWGESSSDAAFDRYLKMHIQIGTVDFCNGCASICVHVESGVVSWLDIEIPEPVRFVNSSVELLGQSFLEALRWSAQWGEDGSRSEAARQDLSKRLQCIDPPAASSNDNIWLNMIDSLRDVDDPTFVISADPAHSRSRY